MKDVKSLQDRAEAEISKLETIVIEIDIVTAMALISQIQLALRHPANKGTAAHIARHVIDGIIAQLPPAMQELAKLGYDERYDTHPEKLQ
jgi:crotonobetainyl-CoA:carnitine CoA-transferase CaiB-like acyl-CoA transferase